jgi:hypothetical protein
MENTMKEEDPTNVKKGEEIISMIYGFEKERVIEQETKYGKKMISDKISKMDALLRKLDKSSQISPSDFNQIRLLALSKGGFMKLPYRREFYKRILDINNKKIIFKYFSNGQITTTVIDSFDKEKEVKTDFDYFIEVDVQRSIANHFFDRSKYDHILAQFKNEVIKFIKCFIFLNNERYGYYQGFHDIALYCYIIFFGNFTLALQGLQRISEFYLKDYMVKLENNKHFTFEIIYKILNEINLKNDRKISKYIIEHTEIPDPLFSLPWILTLFTHDIDDCITNMRVFDYILLSHPNATFHLSSNVLIF